MQSFLTSKRTLAQAAFVAVVAIVIAWRVDLAEAWDVFTSLSPVYAFLGVGCLIASNIVHARKWQELLRGVGDVSLRDSFAVFWASMTANNLIPLRAGDIFRVQVLSQRTGLARPAVAATLFTETVLDGLSFVILIAAVLAIQGRTNDVNIWALAVLVIVVLVVVATVAAARSKPGPELERSRFLRVLPRRARRRAAEFMPHIIDGLRPLGQWRSGITVTVWSVLAWLLEGLAFVAWGEAFRLDAPATALVLAMVAVNVASSVTVLPANLGLFELTAVGVLRAAGVGPSESTAFAVGTHLLVIATISVIGLGTFAYLRLRLTDVFYVRRRADVPTKTGT